MTLLPRRVLARRRPVTAASIPQAAFQTTGSLRGPALHDAVPHAFSHALSTGSRPYRPATVSHHVRACEAGLQQRRQAKLEKWGDRDVHRSCPRQACMKSEAMSSNRQRMPRWAASASMPADNGSSVRSRAAARSIAALAAGQDTRHRLDWHPAAHDRLDTIAPSARSRNLTVPVGSSWLAAQTEEDFSSAPGAIQGESNDR